MLRLGRLARWWWRWMLLWTVIAGLGLVVLLVLPLTNLLPDPQVTLLSPLDGASEVGLQQPLQFSFSTPMDANSVTAALSIIPPIDGSWTWVDARTAQWQPTNGWSPSITYSIQLNTTARSKARQTLPVPFEAQFSTVIAPTVERIWPTPGGRLLQASPLVLHFDQAMQAITEPIQISPTASYTTHWSDAETAMIDIDWQLGRSYSVTLNPILDQSGIPAQAQVWSFEIAMPPIVSVQPLTTTLLGQSQPLSWTFAGVLEPFEVKSITTNLEIEPSTGVWHVRHLATGRTELGWHPSQPWSGNQVSASFSSSARTSQRWRWAIASPLGVVATLPGRDGTMVSNQELRLVFSAAPDPALIRSTLAITPVVSNLDIKVIGTEAAVQGDFSPNRAYTLTLPSVTPPLTLPFHVSAAPQVLRIADQRPFRIWETGTTPQIEIHADSLSATRAALYPLDRGLLLTILRADSSPFEPQRFGLEPLQTWVLSDTTHTTLQFPDLANGGYLFQAQGPAGNRVQQVLVLSPLAAHLITSSGGASALVVDSRTGTPVANLPLTLLSGGSQVAEGITDETGTWQAILPAGIEPDLLIGNDPNALVIATPTLQLNPPSNPLTATIIPFAPDRRQIMVVGHSQERQLINLKIISNENERLTNIQLPVDSDGVFSTTLRLSNATNLRLVLDDRVTLAIPDPIIRHPRLEIRTPAIVTQGEPFTTTFVSYQENGVGLPAQQVEWRLVDLQGHSIAEGTTNTNGAGSATIAIDVPSTAPAAATLIASSGAIVVRQPLAIQPAYQLKLMATKHLLVPAESVALTLTVANHQAMPAAGIPVTITISPDGTTLRATTDSTGKAVVTWRAPRNGAFIAQATAGGIPSEAIQLWVANNGYRGWEQSSALPLAVERFSIVAGEQIRFLPLLQASQGRAYLSWYVGGALRTQVIDWRAGQVLTLSLPANAIGEQPIGIVVVSVENQRSVIRSATLKINQQPALPLTIQTIANTTLLQGANDDTPTNVLMGKQDPDGTLKWQRSTIGVPVAVLESTLPTAVLAWNTDSAIATTLYPMPSTDQPVVAFPSILQRGDQVQVAAFTNDMANLNTSSGLTINNPLQQQDLATWTIQALETGTQSITWTFGTKLLTQTLVIADPLAAYRQISSRIITETTTISASDELIIVPSLAYLEQSGYATLASDPDPLAIAGRIAIAQSGGATASLTQDIITLQEARNDQNGWSWNGNSTDPLYTAMIARLLAIGTPTPEVQGLIERAERYLLQSSSNEPLFQVVLVAIRAKRGEPVQAEIEQLLANNELSTDSQLMLIQALIDLRLERRATSALNAFFAGNPQTTAATQPWTSCGLRSALLGQILLKLDPQNPSLPQVLEELGTCWQGTGWGDAVATTEALLLLQRLPQEARTVQSYRVEDQGRTIYQGARPFQSRSNPEGWTIIPKGPLIVARTTTPSTQPPLIKVWGKAIPTNQTVPTINVGERIVLEWILLVEEPLDYVDFNIALPTGFTLEALTTSGLGIESSHGRIQRLEPGIYTIHALAQPAFAGSLIWPIPIITSAGQPISVAAEFPMLEITPRTP